jgi:hypothetical protein
MTIATGDANASIRYVTPTDWYRPSWDAGIIARYVRQFTSSTRRLLSARIEQTPIRTRPIAAAWLSAIEQRIHGSRTLNGGEPENNGRWLQGDIADAGVEFFQSTSDLLPGEPYIYSSRMGDLVAEFETPHGTLTSIVSKKFVLIFAVIDGNSIEKKAPLSATGLGELRLELKKLTELLRTGRYAAVEPAN